MLEPPDRLGQPLDSERQRQGPEAERVNRELGDMAIGKGPQCFAGTKTA